MFGVIIANMDTSNSELLFSWQCEKITELDQRADLRALTNIGLAFRYALL